MLFFHSNKLEASRCTDVMFLNSVVGSGSHFGVKMSQFKVSVCTCSFFFQDLNLISS